MLVLKPSLLAPSFLSLLMTGVGLLKSFGLIVYAQGKYKILYKTRRPRIHIQVDIFLFLVLASRYWLILLRELLQIISTISYNPCLTGRLDLAFRTLSTLAVQTLPKYLNTSSLIHPCSCQLSDTYVTQVLASADALALVTGQH